MALELRTALYGRIDELRYERLAKRIRGRVGGRTVVDSRRALVLYEPRRVVPTYAVPAEDIAAEVVPGGPTQAANDSVGMRMPDLTRLRVLDPSIPFALHTAPGEAVTIHSGDREVAGFRLADSGLADYVVVDFDAIDEWLEEDEPNVGHPRDPFHRIDILTSSRHVRLELDGVVLAESTEPLLLFETMLPVRFYLRPGEIQVELRPSDTITWCAYKGRAAYFSPVVGGRSVPDLAWTYREPLREAERVRDRIAFFDERIDAVIDGERRVRPITPWS